MSFDSSRFSFNPWNDFFGQVMLQGRVQLDSDWNDWVAQVARRVQVGAFDNFGATAVYPSTTPHAFQLTTSTDKTVLLIGPGRMYVDGLLAENHGSPAPIAQQWVPPTATSTTGTDWDSVLEELVGPSEVPYDQQPYYPGAGSFPTAAPNYLVYLDVWKREVTFIEDPYLVEKAVGIDTTGRIQTVWQVKILPITTLNPTCSSDLQGWTNLLLPPGANLTTGVTQQDSPGPCCLTPNTGFTGLENQLYRIEIHRPGKPSAPSPVSDTATFKWSRDNASVVTAVNSITQSGTVLGVESVGKDNVLCFRPNDWVEITDDWLELNGLPGELRRIAPNGVDPSAKTLTLVKPLTLVQAQTKVAPATFLVNPDGLTIGSRHTRVRRWDQTGKIYQADGKTVWADLDASVTGEIPVPPPNTTLVLEHGVTVTFGWDSTKADFKSSEFWNFAARATDGTVEYLDHAPPRGIHHHYCRLGVGTLANGFSDCRTQWPPASTESGCECACCVTAQEHNSGRFTIQNAIDKVKGVGGGKVCLGPGIYNLMQTISISAATTLTIAGHGATWLNWAPRSQSHRSTAAILIDSSLGVTLENFGLRGPSGTVASNDTVDTPPLLNPGVMIQNSGFVTIQNCSFICDHNTVAANPAIALGGFIVQTSIKNNFISFTTTKERVVVSIGPGVGLSHLPTIVAGDQRPNPLLLTLDLYIEDNFIQTSSSGINLDSLSYHAWQVRVKNNFVGPADIAGITIAGVGLPAPESSVAITDNEIVTSPTGHGIVCGVVASRISDNDILCLVPGTSFPADLPVGDGILLDVPMFSTHLDGLQLVGNRISGVAGIGIEIRAMIASAIIHRNIIQSTGAGGIIMTLSSTAEHLSIVGNQLRDIIPVISNPMVKSLNAALGIRLLLASAAEIEGNTVRNLALDSMGNASRIAIGLYACGNVRISGNQVANIGNADATSNRSAGIAVFGPRIGRVEVSGNTLQRSETISAKGGSTRWSAVFIGPTSDFPNIPNWRTVKSARTNTILVLATTAIFQVEEGIQAVAVRGNFLAASTISALAYVNLSGPTGTESCLFTENQCNLIPLEELVPPTVHLIAPAVIASNNFLSGGEVVLSIQTQTNHLAKATVLGNVVTGGSIQLNSHALPAPWDTLNVKT